MPGISSHNSQLTPIFLLHNEKIAEVVLPYVFPASLFLGVAPVALTERIECHKKQWWANIWKRVRTNKLEKLKISLTKSKYILKFTNSFIIHSLIHSLIQSVIFYGIVYTTKFHRLNMHLRGVYLQNIITPKPLGRGSIKKNGRASRWRVCYQRGLPRLV